MSTPVFVIILVGMQAVFVALDLIDRHCTRQSRHDGEGPRGETFLFLVAVFLVYSAMQYSGFALVPQTKELVGDVQQSFAHGLGRPVARGPISVPWLVGITVFTFYIGGLWDYLMHRFVSHSRWFWFTHEYHHLPNQVFVVMPGLAVRPFAVVSTFPVVAVSILTAYAVVALFGLPLWDLTPPKILLLVQVFVGTASHSSCLRRWWWVHRVMKALALTTPQEHVLHHTVELRGNYGNFTTLWDRVFGTYRDPARAENQGHPLGLPYDQDFLGAITLGKLKLSKRLRQRFQVGRYCNID